MKVTKEKNTRKKFLERHYGDLTEEQKKEVMEFICLTGRLVKENREKEKKNQSHKRNEQGSK